MLLSLPYSFILYSTLLTSIYMTLSSTNWLILWMSLEFNMLSFIPILLMNFFHEEIEASMKYFIIQSISSALLIMSISFMWSTHMFFIFMSSLMIALILKLGSAPCHMWFTSMMSSISWKNCFILSSIQKISPMFIICNMNFKMNMLFLIIMLSSMIGGMGGLNQTHFRTIMAYSSISHLAWMLLLSMTSTMLSFLYLMIYSLSIFPMFFILNKMKMFSYKNFLLNMPSLFNMLILFILLLSLGGMPPLMGFFPKMITLKISLFNNMLLISLILILGSLINLFYYLKISMFYLMSLLYPIPKPKTLMNLTNTPLIMISMFFIPMSLLMTFM